MSRPKLTVMTSVPPEEPVILYRPVGKVVIGNPTIWAVQIRKFWRDRHHEVEVWTNDAGEIFSTIGPNGLPIT